MKPSKLENCTRDDSYNVNVISQMCSKMRI